MSSAPENLRFTINSVPANCPPGEAVELLRNDLKLDPIDWWFTLFATGRGMAFAEDLRLLNVMKEVGLFFSEDSESSPRDFGQWS